jgi:subfamily B ATP-binding cassette protein MsbA
MRTGRTITDPGVSPSAHIGRLWRDFVARYVGQIALLVPVLALVAAAGASYALIMKLAIDAISREDLNAIALTPVFVIAATVVRAVAIYLQAVLSQGLALKVLRDVQNAMFAKLMDVDFARHAREEAGRLVSRFINDINVVSEGLVRGGQALIRDALTLIGAIGLMIWFDWALTLLVAVIFLLAGPPLQAIARRARRQTEAAQVQLGALTTS